MPADALDVSGAWEGDNQDWWDWYVSLADNADEPTQTAAVALRPDPAAVAPLGDDALARELAAPYAVPQCAIDAFRADGFVKLANVLSPGAVLRLRAKTIETLEAAFSARLDGGLRNRFLSAEMLWLSDAVARAFVLSPRIAKIAADLLGRPRVRLYHDNWMSKEPGCGRTPWHYDDHHFPLATNDVVTAWIPGQEIPRAMGPLAFARGMETWRRVADVPFNKEDASYDRRVAEIFRTENVDVEDGPFDVGAVSFHHNLSYHAAGGNRTGLSRAVLATTYFADGARVVDAPTMVSGDWRKFLPGAEPGGLAASPLNPICWPPGADGAREEPAQ
ncbi:MAG: phytanoyl-CoA dioxygenase family protein [Pseudomonadota bacterium]